MNDEEHRRLNERCAAQEKEIYFLQQKCRRLDDEMQGLRGSIIQIYEYMWPLVDKVFPEFSPGSDAIRRVLDKKR